MLVLWQRPTACPALVSLPAWLCGIARHKARKALAHAATSVPSPQLVEIDVDEPERLVLYQEEQRLLDRALDALPFYERTVLVLRLQQGCSYEAIAARMDTPISTVRTRISRAQQRLRRLMCDLEQRPA
jgi:RNA polymerase sigma-70 factor (ECF subfamily)